MFRRSRFSLRPNVGMAGRKAAASQEAPPVNQESGDTAKDMGPSNTDTAVADKSLTPSENLTAQGDGSNQTGDSNTSSAAVQRRKRFSVKPKVLPGRPSVLARTAKSPVKAAKSPVKAGHETLMEVSEKANDLPENDSQRVLAAAAAPRGLQSPRRRRPSEDSQQPKVQAKPNLVPSNTLAAAAEDLQKQSHQLADISKQLETVSDCQVKESHFKVPEKVPPSLPSKDTTEISEKAKTLVSSKFSRPTSAAAFSLSRLLNDPSDLHRLAKARKLRELLKEEIHKEKRLKKSKLRTKEFTLDPAKMTMRDLIHYLPESNPMTSCLEVTAPEDETVIPPLPGREDPPERTQEPAGSQREEEEEEETADGDQEEALLVPQVKVAEDGTLIIDESSLTVEVQRAKGPNLIQDRDPIFERGSTTTYSSFRKGNYSKPWSTEETDMFFLAVSMVGTDFTMICQLFPHRARSEIKNKFKKEERQNSWRIDKAFRERRKLDIEYFSKLLNMILEVQKNRKKHKTLAEKNDPKKKRRRAKGKKAQQKLSDVEEEEEDEIPVLEDDEEEVGEEENGDLCSESQAPASQPKKQRKRRHKQDTTTHAPDEGKRELRDSSKQDQVCIPEHAEASHLEDDANPNRPFTDLASSKYAAVKPDKPPQGRAARPLATLSQICVKNSLSPSSTGKNDKCDEADVTGKHSATEEQASNVTTLQQRKKSKLADDDVSSEEEAKCQPRKPTRYGRMPKPTKPLNYSPKEDTHSSSSSEATFAFTTGPSAPRPKSKCPAKRKGKVPSVQEPKRPKLITLRASQSEYSDDNDENQEWVGPEQQLGCSSSTDSASAFVPASLCSLHPVSVEVEETMEELEIFASMPDVLGISQDSLCSDVKTVENETCSAVPREHQLDLLVDVIDCLPSECTVSEEDSYNEAAQTLLTISNIAHGTQSTENHSAVKDQAEAISVEERNLETDQATASLSENSEFSIQGSTDLSESFANMEPQSSPNDGDTIPACDQKTEPPPQLPPSPEKPEKMSSQTRRSRISKIKPNPVLRQTTRPIRSKTQPEALKKSVEVNEPASSSFETNKIPSAAEVNRTELSQCLSNEICEEKLPEAAAGSQENRESNGMKWSLEPMTTDEILMPGRTSESTDSASDKPAGHASVSELNTVKDSAVTQTRRSRFQKAKPNLLLTARPACLKSQSAQDSKSTPDPPLKWAETDISPPGKSQDLDFESVPPEKKTDPALMVQLHSNVATADQIASDNERTQEATTEISSMPESTEEQINSHMGEVEMSLGAPVQEIGDHAASGDTSTEAPAIRHRKETDSSSLRPVRKSRSQKVKPKPNLLSTSRSVHSNPISTSKAVNANCYPASNPRHHEERVGEVTELPEISSAVKVGERAGPGSDAIPMPDASSSLTATEGFTATKADQTDVGAEGDKEPSADQSTTFTKDLPVQSEEQGTNATAPTSKTGGELLEMVASAEGVGPGSAVMSPPAQESRHPPPSKDLPVSQEEVAPACQTRKGRRVKHKPNLLQPSRTVQSKPQSTEEPVAATPMEQSSSSGPHSCLISASQKDQASGAASAQTPSQSPETSATSEPCSTGTAMKNASLAENQGENVGSSESSAQNEPQRRRRFPKAKPNLGSSARNMSIKPHPSNARKAPEQHHADTTVTLEQHAQMPLQPPEQDSERSASTEMSRDGQNKEAMTSDSVAIAMQAVAEKESARTESNTPVSDDAADISGGQSSENVTADTEMKSVSVDPASVVKERPQQACSQWKGRDTGSSEMAEDRSLAQSTRGDQAEPVTSAESSGKVLTRRSRLVKPKPNLGQNSRSKQIQNIAQTDKDSGGSDVQISKGQPVGGAVEQQTAKNPIADADVSSEVSVYLDQPRDLNVAGSSLGCLNEVTGYTKDLTTSNAVGNQIPADFSIFSEMLSGQVPADPDEPFFILSLTEIPVGSLGEMGDGTSEPLPLPVTELSQQQQQSVSGEYLDEPLAHIVSTEENGLVTVGDIPLNPATSQGSDLDNPVDLHESTPVEPPTSPEAGHWSPSQTRRCSQSTAARQPQRKIDRNASEHPDCLPEQEGRLQKVTLGDGADREDSSSGAQTTHARKVLASSNGSPCDEHKHSAPEPAASTSHSVAKMAPLQQETLSVTPLALPQPSEEDAELISDTEEDDRAEHSGSQEEEPPTSVSQYFLSDIFTEVEDE